MAQDGILRGDIMANPFITRIGARALASAFALSSTLMAVWAAPANAQNPTTFQYGDYCGPGVPAQAAPIGQRTERLAVLDFWWTPADDLDALCFAHDYCFEMLGSDSLICDNAMQATLASFSQRSQPSCAALASNMATAFEYKPWSRGALGRASGVLRAIDNADGVSRDDLQEVAVNSALSNLGDAQQAGSCNLAGASNPYGPIAEFTTQVRAAGVADFNICAPGQGCAHTPPASMPSTAAGLTGEAAGSQEVEDAVGRIRNVFGR